MKEKIRLNLPIHLTDTFDFGKKHPGKITEDVICSDPEYIRWCIDEVKGFELDKQAYTLFDDMLSECLMSKASGNISGDDMDDDRWRE